jgi:hypothetical protein
MTSPQRAEFVTLIFLIISPTDYWCDAAAIACCQRHPAKFLKLRGPQEDVVRGFRNGLSRLCLIGQATHFDARAARS